MTKLLISLILAGWVLTIALVSVQNATPVSLRFLSFQSVQLPLGLVLALGAAVGMVGMALLLPLGRAIGSGSREDFE